MYNSRTVIIGLVVFIGLMTFPFWYSTVFSGPYVPPDLQKPAKGEQCIESVEWMRANHMVMLDEWRHDVVRNGNRIYTATDGKKYLMSLQHTCMDCHTSMDKFCGTCHEANAVDPYCWDCHIVPEGIEYGSKVDEAAAAATGGHDDH